PPAPPPAPPRTVVRQTRVPTNRALAKLVHRPLRGCFVHRAHLTGPGMAAGLRMARRTHIRSRVGSLVRLADQPANERCGDRLDGLLGRRLVRLADQVANEQPIGARTATAFTCSTSKPRRPTQKATACGTSPTR